MTRIAVFGATGRMGQTLIRLIADDRRFSLTGAATEPGHAALGDDAGRVAGMRSIGVAITDNAAAAVAGADVAIDFTLPEALAGNVSACAGRGVAMVIGTTGLSAGDTAAMEEAAETIPIVYGRNMSIGINVLSALARQAGRVLGDEFDCEISEAHHRLKVDAPSGTALQLGESVAEGRGVALDAVAVFDRHAEGAARAPGSIGFSSVRAGNIAGDHSILFGADEELVELRHRALDRAVFARGALRAAAWVMSRDPGFYSMDDVLGLSGR